MEKAVQSGISSASNLAYHFSIGGNKEKAIKYSLIAGNDALSRFSNMEAIKHFTYVIQEVGDDPSYAQAKVDALQGLGEAYFARSMFREAIDSFEHVWKGRSEKNKLKALIRAMDAAFFQGNNSYLKELVSRAESLVTTDRLDWARTRMNRGRANSETPKLFLEDFQAAQKIFEEENSLPDIARNLVGLALAFLANGFPEKAIASELRAIELFKELGDLRGLMDAYNRAGQVMDKCRLDKQALESFNHAIQIGKRISDYNRITEALVSSAWVYESSNELHMALSVSKQALEYLEKTDSHWNKGMTYFNLIRQYSKLDELGLAERYYNKIQELPPAGDMSGFASYKAIFLTAKGQWSEAQQFFKQNLAWVKVQSNPYRKLRVLMDYAWALDKQGMRQEAIAVSREAEEILKRSIERFENTNLQAFFIVPRRVELNERIEGRLEIVNVSRKPIVLETIENLSLTPHFDCKVIEPEFIIKDRSIDLQKRIINSTEVLTVKLNLQLLMPKGKVIAPKIVYFDASGNQRICECEPVAITVKPEKPRTSISNESADN